jgi:arylamine N-acetyltransferase
LWWCDPGNGFPYLSIIRLGDESVQTHPFLEYRLVYVEDRWEIQHRRDENDWFTNYHFTTEYVDLEYFDEMYNNHYTVPGYGPFLTGLRLNKWTEEHGLILRNDTATNSSHTQILNDEVDFEKWVNKNMSPLSINDLLGTNKDIAKIWSVIQ